MTILAATFRLFVAAAGVCLLAGAPTPALAQPGSGGPAPGTPPVNPTGVPVDGGASLLLAGGIGFAVRRLRRRHQR